MDATTIDRIIRALEQKIVVNAITGMTPFASVPKDFKLETLVQFLPDPLRVQQRVTLLTADAFVAYWKRFKSADSVIFGDERSATYVAVIDYHKEAGAPRWCEHLAAYSCPKSPEWTIWSTSDGKQMSQPQFAEFIEDNYPDVTNPSHATMLEVSSKLNVTKDVAFAQATRLDNGQTQLTYNEKITGSVETKAGSLKMIEEFEIAVPVFLGGPKQKVKARLRYRISDGKLVMWYQLHRPSKVVEEATQVVTASIRKDIGADPMFLGSHK